jgi:hypothetical protein
MALTIDGGTFPSAYHPERSPDWLTIQTGLDHAVEFRNLVLSW